MLCLPVTGQQCHVQARAEGTKDLYQSVVTSGVPTMRVIPDSFGFRPASIAPTSALPSLPLFPKIPL